MGTILISGDAYGPYAVQSAAWGTAYARSEQAIHGISQALSGSIASPTLHRQFARPVDKDALREQIIDKAEAMYARGALTIEQLEAVTGLALGVHA